MNPDIMAKFNDKPNWKPEDGVINREFFKWLGNLSENDLKKTGQAYPQSSEQQAQIFISKSHD